MIMVMLTETWLRDQLDAEVNIPGYSLFRSDRVRPKKRRGRNRGGVAIYLRNDLKIQTEVLLKFSSGVIEAICLWIPKLNLVVATVYRQPNDILGGNISTSDQFKELLDKLHDVLENWTQPLPTVVVAGDFNLPNLAWPSGLVSNGVSRDERKMIHMLLNFMSDNFLSQTVDKPTHRGGNILDLFLTNDPNALPLAEISPTAFSSHKMVLNQSFLTHGSNQEQHPPSIGEKNRFDVLNFFNENTNWTQINHDLSLIDWTAKLGTVEITEAFHVFIDTCHEVAKKHTPPKSIRSQSKARVPRDRKILMRKRLKKRKQLQNMSNPCQIAKLECELINIERKLQESYASEEHLTEAKAVDAIKKNVKFFYSYAKKRSSVKSQIGPLEDSEGKITGNPEEMAEILKSQYSSVFSSPVTITTNNNEAPSQFTDDFIFSEQQMTEAIDEVSSNSAPGPDRFPALMLKNCKTNLAKPLCILWRRSLDTGYIPTLLKSSTITPIYKDGPKHLAKNYRPVALTSHLIKVFEKLLRNHLIQYIESHGLMNPNQHGFRAGRSCLSQLLQHFDQVTRLLEQGKNVDVVYLDFGKAFDKLDFQITLQKLLKLGITGKLHKWIESFLTGRKQRVVVQQHLSSETDVISGVPQGSVLGPLLFLVMISDIDAHTTTSFVSSFADDTRVMAGTSSSQDVTYMQNDLNIIYQWAQNNNATFNAGKFECLRYGRNQDLIASTAYLSNSATPIACSTSVRDLGVTMSSDATFNEHISKICTAASLKCGWILRTFKTRERLPLLILWKALVLPTLDYCCQLWTPAALGLIQRIEQVQVSYLKKIVGMNSYDYWEQLDMLNLYSLERRRERYIAIYVWKILENLVPNFGINVAYNKRKGRYCIIPKVHTTATQRVQTIRFNSLAVNGPRIFNCLPISLRNKSGCSVQSFKSALDKHLQTVPDEPRVAKLIKFCSKGSNSLIQY